MMNLKTRKFSLYYYSMHYTIGLFLMILFVCGYYGCSLFNDDNLTGTGSQAGNGIILGTVFTQESTPAVNCEVFIRKNSFLKDTSQILLERIPDTYTDSLGRFTLDSIKPGEYTLEINDKGNSATIKVFKKDSADTFALNLDTLILQSTASLQGNVATDDLPQKVILYAQIYGLDYIQRVDDQGHYYFPSIPAGDLQLKILNRDPNFGTIDNKKIKLKPGEQKIDDTLYLPYMYWQDTIIIRSILDNNGLTTIEAAGVIIKVFKGRVSELNFYGRGLRHLPPNIGKLRLTYLNLGNNSLDTLPGNIGRLKSLKRLEIPKNRLRRLPRPFADLVNLTYLDLSDNNLRIFPPEVRKLSALTELYLNSNTLGKMKGDFHNLTNLKTLDLSDNRITEFPPSITRLRPDNFFSINYNQLNLNEMHPDVEAWIDTYSYYPDWRETQSFLH